MLLTGEGPLSLDLRMLAESLPTRDRIKFLGHVPDVRIALHAGDIYVLPSDEEGFGIALAEAMACKLVCVSTKTTGPREVIEDGRTGFLVDISCEGVLGGLLKALALNDEEKETMTTRARQAVIDKFSLQQAVEKGLAYLEIERTGHPVV